MVIKCEFLRIEAKNFKPALAALLESLQLQGNEIINVEISSEYIPMPGNSYEGFSMINALILYEPKIEAYTLG